MENPYETLYYCLGISEDPISSAKQFLDNIPLDILKREDDLLTKWEIINEGCLYSIELHLLLNYSKLYLSPTWFNYNKSHNSAIVCSAFLYQFFKYVVEQFENKTIISIQMDNFDPERKNMDVWFNELYKLIGEKIENKIEYTQHNNILKIKICN